MTIAYEVAFYDGTAWTDISDYVAAFQFSRGRSRELDAYQAGTCSVSLRNYDGRFLPEAFTGVTNTEYAEDPIVPGQSVYIRSEGFIVFYGYVEDSRWLYDAGKTVIAGFTLIDAMSRIGRLTQQLDLSESGVAGDVMETILNDAQWDATNDYVTTGTTANISVDVTEGQLALPTVQQIALAEGVGRLYAHRGLRDLIFEGRHALAGATVERTFGDGGIEILRAEFGYGADLLYNQVRAESQNGLSYSVSDTASRAAYGDRSLVRSGLLLNNVWDLQSYCEMLLEFYKEPQARVAALTVNLYALSYNERQHVGALDIGSLVRVVFTPRGADEIDANFVVEGISHAATVNSHEVTLQLSPAPSFSLFELDTDQLDIDQVGP